MVAFVAQVKLRNLDVGAVGFHSTRPVVASPCGVGWTFYLYPRRCMTTVTVMPSGVRPQPDGRWLDPMGRQLADICALLRDSSRPGHVHHMSVDRGHISVAGGSGGGRKTSSIDTSRETQLSIEDVYREHAAAMYRLAVTVVRDHALAEDAVQEAIVKAWRNLDTFRGEASLRTWLLRITHNTAVSILRGLRDTPVDPLRMQETPVAGPGEQDHRGALC